MKYKFQENFNDLEFTNPTIEILSDGITIYPSRMMIDVSIVMTVDGAKYGVRLTDVPVQNMNFEVNSLETRTLKRLEDYQI